MYLTEEEFEGIKSLCHVPEVKIEQVNNVIRRIKQCRKRLQLRFPSVFRDGVLLQFLTKYIKLNKNIIHFACGLSNNYSSGFYALNEILALKQITKLNLRINDLGFACNEFFGSISRSNATKLYLKIDEISDQNMKLLCDALQENKNIKHLTFSCKSLTDQSMQYFADFCANNTVRTLSLSIDAIPLTQVHMFCDGLRQSQCIQHLDVEDCKLNGIGMKHLTDTLTHCNHITALTIGNNGFNAMQAFFEGFGALQYISKLICNECQLIRAEKIDLNIVSTSLNAIHKFNRLSKLQIPLFIFDDTSHESMQLFVDSLSNCEQKLEVLQLFPLFEHLDKASWSTNPDYCNKISFFFDSLFRSLSHTKHLRKLYIEMIGSEGSFFTEQVANSFMHFLLHSNITELYAPFCCLIDLNEKILDSFKKCKQLISIQDDTLDYQWLNDSHPASRYTVDEEKKKELVKAKRYHQIAHKQCQNNISNEVIKYVPVKDLSNLVSTFCGFQANPQYWLTNEH
eukprot:324310_1